MAGCTRRKRWLVRKSGSRQIFRFDTRRPSCRARSSLGCGVFAIDIRSAGAETDPNVFGFEICLQSLRPHLAADTTLFPAAEGGCQLGDVVDVDADAAELQLLGDQERLPEVLAKHIRDKSVLCAVGTPDDLVERGEAGDWRDRPEGLLAHGLCLVRDVGEDGWLVEMAL